MYSTWINYSGHFGCKDLCHLIDSACLSASESLCDQNILTTLSYFTTLPHSCTGTHAHVYIRMLL